MPTGDASEALVPPISRDELVALVARAHHGAPYAECALAGRALAAASKLPKIVAENLGAGFGQWDFFPEAADIVAFAEAYAPPSTDAELWAIARAWAADDAQGRPTILALVGREILQHELRRIDVPALRALCEETRASRLREIRVSLGLEVGAATEAPSARAKPTGEGRDGPRPARAAASAGGSASAAPKREIPTRMPKPEFKKPAAAPPPAPPKRFQHPKFGEGVLVSQDGAGPEAKLTVKFDAGVKTLLARFVTELPG